MKSKPVRKYAQPKYPTRLEIAARPALLQRQQPPTNFNGAIHISLNL